MSQSLDSLFNKWLRLLKIQVSSGYLKNQLLSHPDFPSLLSITDTLDELGIENASLVIDKEKFFEIPVPFLAHMNSRSSDFLLVKNAKEVLERVPDFLQKWDGIAVIAEKPTILKSVENQRQLIKERKDNQIVFTVIALIIGLSLYKIFSDFNWLNVALMGTTLVGFAVAVLIVQHELGISNSITEQLCQAGKNTDCDAVLNSKKSKLFDLINPADATFIWFSTLFLILTVSLFSGISNYIIPLIALLTTCAMIPTLFSLYYQWRMVKKWCTLCLITIGVLCVQELILMLEVKSAIFKNISIDGMLFMLLATIVVASVWLLLLKPTLKRIQEIEKRSYRLQRLKNDSMIFMALLKQQRKIDMSPFEDDLQVGNPDGALQIMVACSLYCGPCIEAHKILDELISTYNIGVTIRFSVDLKYKEDNRVKAAEYILRLVNNCNNQQKCKVIHDWYSIMNFDEFRERYPLIENIDVFNQLRKHEKWSNVSQIEFTPTIFINGYELPKQYKIQELSILIKGIEEKIRENYIKV